MTTITPYNVSSRCRLPAMRAANTLCRGTANCHLLPRMLSPAAAKPVQHRMLIAHAVNHHQMFSDKQWEQAFETVRMSKGFSSEDDEWEHGVSFNAAMLFDGPAPEITNGRVAMLGFLTALGVELCTGQPLAQQFTTYPVAVVAVFLLWGYASLAPILKGADLDETFGPFTPAAEQLNGRLAMIGLAALLAIEYIKGSALL